MEFDLDELIVTAQRRLRLLALYNPKIIRRFKDGIDSASKTFFMLMKEFFIIYSSAGTKLYPFMDYFSSKMSFGAEVSKI